MTFDPNIPLASNEPGIFPAQSQTNFGRLQTLISADHQFNNSIAPNDGYHNLIHMTPQAPTEILSGIGRTYVRIVDGLTQLFYMDDANTEYQITPNPLMIIKDTALVGSLSIVNIFPNPGYDYTGDVTAYVNGSSVYRSAVLVKSGTATSDLVYSENNVGGGAPGIAYGNGAPGFELDLFLGNGLLIPQQFVWTISIIRTT